MKIAGNSQDQQLNAFFTRKAINITKRDTNFVHHKVFRHNGLFPVHTWTSNCNVLHYL